MTVATETNRNDYVGNGAADTYGYTFRVLDDDDLLVQVEDTDGDITTLVKATDYTVTGVGVYAGGNVVLVDNDQAWLDAGGDLLTDYRISIRRRMDLLQPTDLRNRGSFYPETHETLFDRLVMYDQQQQDELDRALKFPQTDGTGLTVELPAASVRALKFMAFDASGNVIASSGGISSAIPVSAFMETVLDDASGSAVLTTVRNNLADETAPAADDELFLRDTSAGAVDRITLANFFKAVNALTEETDPAVADMISLYDASAAAARRMTPGNFLKVINLLTEDAAPDAAADFFLEYDASASAVKKVLMNRFVPTQAQMETGTANTAFITPGTLKWYPTTIKASGKIDVNAGAPSISDNRLGLTSIVDNGTGDLTVNWSTNFSSVGYEVFGFVASTSATLARIVSIANATQLVGSCRLICNDAGGVVTDPEAWHICAVGDFA